MVVCSCASRCLVLSCCNGNDDLCGFPVPRKDSNAQRSKAFQRVKKNCPDKRLMDLHTTVCASRGYSLKLDISAPTLSLRHGGAGMLGLNRTSQVIWRYSVSLFRLPVFGGRHNSVIRSLFPVQQASKSSSYKGMLCAGASSSRSHCSLKIMKLRGTYDAL